MASKPDFQAGATKSTRSAYSAARPSTTGNSRRQVGHHSAQNTMKTGLHSSERVYEPPSPSSRVKSGAIGRSDSSRGQVSDAMEVDVSLLPTSSAVVVVVVMIGADVAAESERTVAVDSVAVPPQAARITSNSGTKRRTFQNGRRTHVKTK